jgi:hypothetical protein
MGTATVNGITVGYDDEGEGPPLVLADTTPHPDTEDGRRYRRETADRLLAEGMAGYADERPRYLFDRPQPGIARSLGLV